MEIDREAVLSTFMEETLDGLDEMEGMLVLMENRPEDAELVETTFRVAHTLKGNASIVGFPKVGEFTHALEEVLESLRARTLAIDGALVTLLLKTVDALRQMVPDAVAGEETLAPNHVKLMRRLSRVASTGISEPEAAAPIDPEGEKRRRSFGRRRENIQDWLDRRKTLRVDIEKLDQLLNLTGEISVARARMTEILESSARRNSEEVLETHRGADHLYSDLQEQVMGVRMVPIRPMLQRYVRTVRDMAMAQEKSARLVIEGEDVELDTTVSEHIRDPLTHMIRNAIDHGIEPPHVRQASGKDPCGCITIRTFHEAGSVLIQLSDDGRGLDRQRILEVGRSRGLVGDSQELSDWDTYQLIFRPGFTTREAVTEVSGRGVGMDVVRRNVEALHGSIEIESEEGRGAMVSIHLPLTLAVVKGFLVGVGSETYVLPLGVVMECLALPVDDKRSGDLSGVIDLRGEPLPYVRLRKLFKLHDATPDRESVVVVQFGASRSGLVVDHLLGEAESVIKPLGKSLMHQPSVSGSTILGSGRVALMLDMSGIFAASHGHQPQLSA